MADSPINITVVNLAEIQEYLRRMPEETFSSAKVEYARATLNAEAEVKGNFGPKLKVRTGSLRRSIGTLVSGSDINTLKASIYGAAYAGGTQLRYTLAQEYGATIRAKKAYRNVPGGPYLNIPTKANKTAAGVMRKTAKSVFDQGGAVVRYGAGKYGVMLKGQMMFTLHKEVKIPARLGMTDAAESQVTPLLTRLADVIGEY